MVGLFGREVFETEEEEVWSETVVVSGITLFILREVLFS